TGDPLLELPGFRIGKAGIEKIHDLVLRGTGGSSQVEVNAFGHVIRELSRQEGQPGAEVALTVDLGLQRMVSRRLGKRSAAAVVMDVHNGDILALASTPSFDPNAFNKGLSADEWRTLASDPKAPLTNKAISGHYPPGSTFKMVVLLAALEKGAVTPETTVFCTGKITLGDATFHCWRKGGHGLMDAFNGLTQSCDVYFYELARRTGIERIAAMARRLGFGETLGLDLPGEQPGLVPDRKWKRRTMNAPWHQGETLLMGIGQGYLLATPLQMAVMVARLVNGGYAVTPRLTRPHAADLEDTDHETDRRPAFESLGLVPGHRQLVRRGMEAVVNDPSGTAFRARIRKRGMEMGGKTGTVQVRRITKAEREEGIKKNKDLPWRDRDHAMFVGFAPTSAPRYAVSVVVEHGGGGASVAAPIARDILLEAQRRGSARPGILPGAPAAPARQAVGAEPPRPKGEG
ncbi:MAG: penicillin-binding protein 2, partial [Rhodospirillales bacterium]